jgi:hypothetical protein
MFRAGIAIRVAIAQSAEDVGDGAAEPDGETVGERRGVAVATGGTLVKTTGEGVTVAVGDASPTTGGVK